MKHYPQAYYPTKKRKPLKINWFMIGVVAAGILWLALFLSGCGNFQLQPK